MIIKGKVIKEVSLNHHTSSYELQGDDGRYYKIIAKDKEAVKDYLFVRKGQQISIEGSKSGKAILKKKAVIKIISKNSG